MDFEGFVTFDYITSFAGMIAVVVLLTQFTKGIFDKLVDNKTRFIVYGWSFVLSTAAALFTGTWTTAGDVVQTVIVWLVNSVVVWFMAIKAYEAIANKTKG